MRTAAIVAASIGGTLLVGGAAVYFFLLRKPPEDTSKTELRTKLLAACEATIPRLHGRRETNRCFVDQAQLWSKAEYCDPIESEPGRHDIEKADCRSRVARDTGNVELCKQTGALSATTHCMTAIAERNEDASLCQFIAEPRGLNGCIERIAEVTKQPELCNKISTSRERDSCLRDVVRRGGSISACAAIQDQRQRNECAADVARHGDPNACLQVEADNRANCWGTVNVPLDDLRGACGDSTRCLAQLNGYGTEACALIPDEKAFERGPCFAQYMQRSGGYDRPWVRDSACEKQASASARDECFAALGAVKGRASACERVSAGKLRQTCLAAAGKQDPAVCRSLTDPVEAKRCVADSNMETLDSSVCQLLDEPNRRSCLRRVQSHVESMVQRGR